MRPQSIQVQLKANGNSKGEQIELNAENNWTYTWSNLDVKLNGQAIAYTLEEVEVPDGYTSEITGDAASGFIITNTHTPETTTISGKKTWDDANNQDGKRPGEITVNLLADDVKVESKKVTANDKWEFSFTNLPKYKNGVKIKYTVTEEAVEGYTTEITGDTASGFTVTNSYTPETTSISAKKVWFDNNNQDGLRADVTLRLMKQVEDDPVVEVVNQERVINKFAEEKNLVVSWDNLPVYEGGKLITYTVAEDAIDGYTTEITGDVVGGFRVTNTYIPVTTSVSGTKTWSDDDDQDGKRPESITVNLLADGTKVDSMTVTAEENWKYRCFF